MKSTRFTATWVHSWDGLVISIRAFLLFKLLYWKWVMNTKWGKRDNQRKIFHAWKFLLASWWESWTTLPFSGHEVFNRNDNSIILYLMPCEALRSNCRKRFQRFSIILLRQKKHSPANNLFVIWKVPFFAAQKTSTKISWTRLR